MTCSPLLYLTLHVIVLQNTICEGTDDHCEKNFVVLKDHRVCVVKIGGVRSEQ